MENTSTKVVPDKLYYVREIAKILDLSTATIYNAIKAQGSKNLKASIKRSNGRYCVKGIDLLNWNNSFL
jgi:transposase